MRVRADKDGLSGQWQADIREGPSVVLDEGVRDLMIRVP